MTMKSRGVLCAAVAAGGIAVAAASAAVAQGMTGGMGPGMMQGSGMTPGGTSPGMTGSGDGPGAMFGGRVDRGANLSVEDVTGYLSERLARLGNKRLKVGKVESDASTITADIVTIEDSLVQRLKVDRRSGVIDYQN